MALARAFIEGRISKPLLDLYSKGSGVEVLPPQKGGAVGSTKPKESRLEQISVAQDVRDSFWFMFLTIVGALASWLFWLYLPESKLVSHEKDTISSLLLFLVIGFIVASVFAMVSLLLLLMQVGRLSSQYEMIRQNKCLADKHFINLCGQLADLLCVDRRELGSLSLEDLRAKAKARLVYIATFVRQCQARFTDMSSNMPEITRGEFKKAIIFLHKFNLTLNGLDWTPYFEESEVLHPTFPPPERPPSVSLSALLSGERQEAATSPDEKRSESVDLDAMVEQAEQMSRDMTVIPPLPPLSKTSAT